VQRAVAHPPVNARLALLYDGTEESLGLPAMDLLRSGLVAAQALAPPLSIARMRRVVKYNAFQVWDTTTTCTRIMTLTLILTQGGE
jgi:hypothetical protein